MRALIFPAKIPKALRALYTVILSVRPLDGVDILAESSNQTLNTGQDKMDHFFVYGTIVYCLIRLGVCPHLLRTDYLAGTLGTLAQILDTIDCLT